MNSKYIIIIILLSICCKIILSIDSGSLDTSKNEIWKIDQKGAKYLQSYTDATNGFTIGYNAYYSPLYNMSRFEMENTTIIDWNNKIAYTWPGVVYDFENKSCAYYKIDEIDYKLFYFVDVWENLINSNDSDYLDPNKNEINEYLKLNDFGNNDFKIRYIISKEYITKVNFDIEFDYIDGYDCEKVEVNCARESIFENLNCKRDCYQSQYNDDGYLYSVMVSNDTIDLGNVSDIRQINNYFGDTDIIVKLNSIEKASTNSSEWLNSLIFWQDEIRTNKYIEIGENANGDKINKQIVTTGLYELPINPKTYFNIQNLYNSSQCIESSSTIKNQILKYQKKDLSSTLDYPFKSFNGSFNFLISDDENYKLEWGYDSSSSFEFIVQDDTSITTINHKDLNTYFANLNSGYCDDLNKNENETRDSLINKSLQQIFMPQLFNNDNNTWSYVNSSVYRGIEVDMYVNYNIAYLLVAKKGWGFIGRDTKIDLPYPVGIKLFDKVSDSFIPIYIFSFTSKSDEHELFNLNFEKCFPILPTSYKSIVSINSNLNGISLQFNEISTTNGSDINVLVSNGKYSNDNQMLISNNQGLYKIINFENNSVCFKNPKSNINNATGILENIGFSKSVSFFYANLRDGELVTQSYIGQVNYRGRAAHKWRVQSNGNKVSHPYLKRVGYNTNFTADLYYELFESKLKDTDTMTPLSVSLNLTFTLKSSNSSTNQTKIINNSIYVDYILFEEYKKPIENYNNITNDICKIIEYPNFNSSRVYEKNTNDKGYLNMIIPKQFSAIIEVIKVNSSIPSIYKWDHSDTYKGDIFSNYNLYLEQVYYYNSNTNNNKTILDELLLFKFLVYQNSHPMMNNSFNLNSNIIYKGVPVDITEFRDYFNFTIKILYYPIDWQIKSYDKLSLERIPICLQLFKDNQMIEQWDILKFNNLNSMDLSTLKKGSTISDSSSDKSNKSNKLTYGGIVGIIISTIIVVSVVVGAIVMYMYKRKQKYNNSNDKAVLLEEKVLNDLTQSNNYNNIDNNNNDNDNNTKI